MCVRFHREDTTETGHLLGPAQHLSKQATPERDLSPVACTIIRLIMHAALVWSSVCVEVKIVHSSFAFKLEFLTLGECKYHVGCYTSYCKA